MIREIKQTDIELVLALNNAAAPAVNALTFDGLEEILRMAQKTWVAEDDGSIVGALVVIGPKALYQSANYSWLDSQFENFCYVDRIIISPSNKRKGLGWQFYDRLDEHAARINADVLLCEVNIEPENPQSLAFHTSLGWTSFHDREHGPGKVVRYFKKNISTEA